MISTSKCFSLALASGPALLLLLFSSSAWAQTYEFPVLDDAMLAFPSNNDDNFGGRNETSVGIFSGSQGRRTLLRFDVSAAMAEINDPSVAVLGATLTLNPRDQRSGIQGTGSAQLGVYGLVEENQGWFEGTQSGSGGGPTGEFGSVSARFLATPSSMSNSTSDGSPLPDPQVDTDGQYWFGAGGGPTGTPLLDDTELDVATDTTNELLGQADTADIDIVADADWGIALNPQTLEPFLAEWLDAPQMDDGSGGMQTSNAGLVVSHVSGSEERWFFETNEGRMEEAARLTLTFGPRPVTGDVNGDELVNSADFETIRQNFWQPFEDRTDGDLINDDFIDFSDYAQWKQAAKDPDPLAAASRVVPEPSTLTLLASVLMLSVRRRAL